MQPVNCCCNVIWLLLVGWELCLAWCFSGLIYCATIIGIPFGIQAFKIGCFVLWPFGKQIVDSSSSVTVPCSCFCNFLWIITSGLIIGFLTALSSIIFFVSIIGIPFGIQLCKLAVLSFAPFGKEVIDEPNVPTVVIQAQPVLQPQYGPVAQAPPQYMPPPQYAPPPTQGPPMYIPPSS